MRITRPLLLLGSLFLLSLCIGCAVGQGVVDDMENHEGVVILDRRQDDNSTSPTADSPDTPSSTVPPSSSPEPPTSTPPTSRTTSSRTTSTTIDDPPTTDKTTDVPKPTTEDSPPTTRTTSSKKTSTAIITKVVTTRINNSNVESTMVQTSVGVFPTAGLSASEGDSGGSGGLSTATKNVIIGVVVGVGGAIILGGLGIVLWRLKKKKSDPVDEDDLMRRDGSPLAESGRDMHSASTDASPFQATLDQYHKPPGQVNTSSNF